MADAILDFSWHYNNYTGDYELSWIHTSGAGALSIGISDSQFLDFADCDNIGNATSYIFSGDLNAYYIAIYKPATDGVTKIKIYPPGLLMRGYQDATIGKDNILYIAYGTCLLKIQLRFDFCKVINGKVYTKELYNRLGVF